jgi:hypothetical protein
VVDDGSALPPGTKPLLRTASVDLGGRDELRLHLPAGSFAIERLGTPAARRAVEVALGERLGREITLSVHADAAQAAPDPAARITAESARRDRLARLMEQEPLLAQAVQAWDLELLD